MKGSWQGQYQQLGETATVDRIRFFCEEVQLNNSTDSSFFKKILKTAVHNLYFFTVCFFCQLEWRFLNINTFFISNTYICDKLYLNVHSSSCADNTNKTSQYRITFLNWTQTEHIYDEWMNEFVCGGLSL